MKEFQGARLRVYNLGPDDKGGQKRTSLAMKGLAEGAADDMLAQIAAELQKCFSGVPDGAELVTVHRVNG